MKLFIVGLPIGNIEDISLRALRVLQETKYLICEDTRMFNNLWSKLMQLDLAKKFEGKIHFINDFNEYKELPRVLAEVCSLESAVLVSDAGMPLISDPGYKLVRQAIDNGWEIDVVPGPTAESAALAVSGLPTDRYLFLGFLNKKPGKRLDSLKVVKEMGKLSKLTAVIYESPMRIQKIMPDVISIFGEDAPACLAVDLTKVSQKILRGSLTELSDMVATKKIKGELVLLISVE
ncbi:MAG TPA: 16S rRNA (cytidine(1402)-2'-O)-methyltransferase [Candidatus Woesebacteria bacterium]|nr:16S rRNA (cytidine(1402)-2'-O)-methyltransferase [Candidatus Woesebacteria bacterium]